MKPFDLPEPCDSDWIAREVRREQREDRIEELIEQYLEDDLVIYDAINDNQMVRKAISEICQILPKMDNAREDRKPDYVAKLIEQCKRIEFAVVKYVTERAENDA